MTLQLQTISFSKFKKETHHKHVKFTWTSDNKQKVITKESKKFYCNPYGESLSLPSFLMTKAQKWEKINDTTYQAESEFGSTLFEVIE